MSKQIVLKNTGNTVSVDDNWYPFLTQWSWNENESGYACRTTSDSDRDNIKVLMHRLVLGNPKDGIVDHIDRNPRNNTFSNLRVVSPTESRWNRGKLSTNNSGYIGVSLASYGRYRVNPNHGGKRYHLGYFFDPIEAALVYDKFIFEKRGEFAVLNFPENIINGQYVSQRVGGDQEND